jgi:hypothetical protein
LLILGSDDVVLAQITSIANKDLFAIELKNEDFQAAL